MAKKFDIRKTFETFWKEPLSILTEGLFQIVNIESNIFSEKSSFHIDFMNNKTQLTIINNPKMYNLLSSVLHRKQVRDQKEKAAGK